MKRTEKASPLILSFGKSTYPSEVAAPVELLRAGLVFQARPLLNARTIQTHLDWIWPFWVQRQFDPPPTPSPTST